MTRFRIRGWTFALLMVLGGLALAEMSDHAHPGDADADLGCCVMCCVVHQSVSIPQTETMTFRSTLSYPHPERPARPERPFAFVIFHPPRLPR